MLSQMPYNNTVKEALKQYVKEVRPDVAHVHNVFPMISPSVYVALKEMDIPVVQTLHNYRFMCPNGTFYIGGKVCERCQQAGYGMAVRNRCMYDSRLISYFYSRAIQQAWANKIIPDCIDRFIALNKFTEDQMIKAGVPAGKIGICGNFLDKRHEGPLEKKNYVLYLGRLSREKGLETLLRAVDKSQDVYLKIAGTGPDETALKAQIENRKDQRVEMLGYIAGKAKDRLISEALCMVVPSEWYENFPISVVEALMSGTPVIASRIGGLPEIIDDEITGMLFEPGNSEALSVCLKRIANDRGLAMRMAESARVTAKSRFNAQPHYECLLNIYKDVVR